MRLILATAAILAMAAGCGTAPTTSAMPDKFTSVQTGTYDPARQPLFVDCVFDGFLGAQNIGLTTHVRQVKRANGYRIDVIAQAFQYVVADIRDDGQYEMTRSSYAAVLNFDKEQEASRACLEKFGKVASNAEPTDRSRQGPSSHYMTPGR